MDMDSWSVMDMDSWTVMVIDLWTVMDMDCHGHRLMVWLNILSANNVSTFRNLQLFVGFFTT